MKMTKWLGYGEDFSMVAEHCLLIVFLCDRKSPRSFFLGGGVLCNNVSNPFNLLYHYDLPISRDSPLNPSWGEPFNLGI